MKQHFNYKYCFNNSKRCFKVILNHLLLFQNSFETGTNYLSLDIRIMESNNRKKYVMINRETGSNGIFAMLDAIGSDNESDIDNLLEDSDTEYVAEEPVPADNEDSHDVLTPEANIHIENTASSSTDPPRKKLKHATASLKWQRKPKLIKRKNCELEAKILLDLPVNPSPLRVFESTTRLNIW